MSEEYNYYNDPGKREAMIFGDTLKAKKGRHSAEFLMILEQASPDTAIRTITHAKPLLVFWVTPDGNVLDANDAHFDNPPNGDKSVLSSPTHKGHLRGRAAMIGPVLYVVVYGDKKTHSLTAQQMRLLKKSHHKITEKLANKGASAQAISSAQFIQENGEDILV